MRNSTVTWYDLTASERDIFRAIVGAYEYDIVNSKTIVQAAPEEYTKDTVLQTIADLMSYGVVEKQRGNRRWMPNKESLLSFRQAVSTDSHRLQHVDELGWPVRQFSDDQTDSHQLLRDRLETRTVTIKENADGPQFITEGILDERVGPIRCTCGDVFHDPSDALEHDFSPEEKK